MLDIIIQNGMIIDGSGNPWYQSDIGIQNGEIVAIRRNIDLEAKRLIQAERLVVSPGFIDMHSHSDLMLLQEPTAKEKIHQGITTELLGQDGIGVAPIKPADIGNWRKVLSGLAGDPPIDWSWRSFGDYLNALEVKGTCTNPAVLVSFGAIRQMVIGLDNRKATLDEIEEMKKLTAEAMQSGAVGMSLGLIYLPCFYASRDELIEIFRIVGHYDGFMVVHIRNEAELAEEAMQEVIDICIQANLPLHISHFKTAGRTNWHKSEIMLEMAEHARRNGLEVTFDQYPYIAGSTMFFAILPQWVLEGGADKLVERLKVDDLRLKIKRDIKSGIPGWQNMVHDTGWDRILITSVKSEKNRCLEGKYMTEIADIWGKTPEDAALDLLLEEDASVGMATFAQSESNVKMILKHDFQMVCTDGLLGGKPHPRVYGSFPRILGKYVREEKVITLPQAIRKMTSMPAQRLGLKDRGLIREGLKADVVVFDPETIIDTATFEAPRQYPVGIHNVIVNGSVVIDEGKHNGNMPGKVIRRI
jgi:N-acyl-D-amino-acid deacylase